ncbi:MAG: response regulator [Deltaproteobacteria bacterium]|nr:response regulator [Deltaproteobacteria bacterium]
MAVSNIFKKVCCRDFFKGYCSILGFKIAIPVAIFMILPIIGHMLLHEYTAYRAGTVYSLISNPALWGVVAMAFLSLMFILSKVVILPLKKFEQHISDLEKGKKSGPLVINSKDEISYLADRFNILHKGVTNEIESRNVQLSVLYNFTNATAGIFDIHTLMDSFFNILRTAVEFDVGAYVLHSHNMTEGEIFTSLDTLSGEESKELTKRLFARAGEFCWEFSKELTGELEVSHLSHKDFQSHVAKQSPAYFIELPIVCSGKPIGIISLVSYSGTGTDPVMGSKVFNAMVQHANTVIERLLTHMSAEEKKLANILSSMSEGVYLIDKKGHATSVNKKGLELVATYCNYSLDCAKKTFEPGLGCCAVPGDACEFSRLIDQVRNSGAGLDGKVYTQELKNKDGLIMQVSVSELRNEKNQKEGYVITSKDVTEDRLIQKRVMLSSKLAALGEMAAGIAHEINNPLQVMMANLELLEPSVSEKGVRRLDHLKDGILRIKSIVKDLLIFAREQTTEVEDVDINAVIQKVGDIMGHQLQLANINFELALDGKPLRVRCNRNLFQQVLINLMQNAKDAIEESRKGDKIYIRTVLLSAGLVLVEVSDNGPGIPENIVDRVFDPFFTTKDVGKGTGLGLSVSRRIVEGMGGNISVCSSPKIGTTFTVTLLHHSRKGSEDTLKPKDEPDYSKLGGKSVIIVDDEEGVLRAVKESLGSKVMSIECVNGGQAAFDMLMDKDFDIILLDIKMPGMNGMELYRNLNDSKPYLTERIVFLTGDTENESTNSFIKLTGCRYLSKPFTMKELLNSMCEYELEMS